ATPPSGVTARCVSRRITRSFDSRALISRGTELSAASGFILLLSQMSTRKQNAELRNSGLYKRASGSVVDSWVSRKHFLPRDPVPWVGGGSLGSKLSRFA